MSSQRPNPLKERELFEQAMDLPKGERDSYLATACGGDPGLRRRVEALLSSSETEEGFLPERAEDSGLGGAGKSGTILEQAGDRIGRYYLLEKIGEGSCGIVYMAEQREPMRRRVAVKILKAGLDTKGVVARFEAERQALALMDHPSIARVLDGGATETGRPYFVMELVRGRPITEFCDEKQYSLRQRLEVFRKVCDAVQHAHQKGVIHRDLKPSNILVTVNDGVAVPKVIDFGIAKATGQQLTDKTLFTHFHAFIGTPAYMSPEQAELSSVDVDTRTDVYSLGVLLYELLVGRAPFNGQELLASGWDSMRRTLREEEPVRPSTRLRTLAGNELTDTAIRRRCEAPELANHLRGDLDWIVLKCLEKDRARRYDSADALAQDVRRHLETEPIFARPPTVAYRFQKAFQRNRLAFTAGALVALTLLVSSVFSTWTLFREKAARSVAENQTARANHETLVARASERSARQAAYAADMQAAELAIQENNPGRARALLTAYRPQPGEEDLRGIEWRWLWHINQDQAAAVLPQPGIVNDLVVAPDGRWLASICLSGAVKIWEGGSLRLMTEFAVDGPEVGAVSPDGRLLAIRTAKGTVLRETRGWQLVRTLPDLRHPLVFGQEGRHLFGLEKGKLVRWNVQDDTREEIPSPFEGTGITLLAPLGKDRLAVASYIEKHGIAIVSSADGKVIRRLDGIPWLHSLAASPDGRWVAAGERKGRVSVWDAESGQMIGPMSAHSRLANRIAFSPDSTRMATIGGDQMVRLWRLPSSAAQELEPLAGFRGHDNLATTLGFASDGARLFTGAKDATVRVWSLTQLNAAPASPEGDPGAVIIGISHDGGQIITAGKDGIQWWDTDGYRPIRKQHFPFHLTSTPVWAGSSHVFATADPGDVVLWDPEAEDGKGTERWRAKLGSNSLRTLAFTTNGSWIAVGQHSPVRQLHLFQLPGDTPVTTLTDYEGRPGSYSRPAAFSPDGRWLAYAGPKFSVVLWDIQKRQIRLTMKGMLSHFYALAFSPDGGKVAAAGREGAVCVWDCETGELRLGPFLAHGVEANHVEFSADGRTLLTTAMGGSLRMWNAANGRQMLTFPDAESTAGPLLSADNHRLVYWDKVTHKVVVMVIPQLLF